MGSPSHTANRAALVHLTPGSLPNLGKFLSTYRMTEKVTWLKEKVTLKRCVKSVLTIFLFAAPIVLAPLSEIPAVIFAHVNVALYFEVL